MKRRLLNVLAGLSLLLSVATAGFWLRSYDPGDLVQWYSPPRSFEILSTKGLVEIAFGTLVSKEYPPRTGAMADEYVDADHRLPFHNISVLVADATLLASSRDNLLPLEAISGEAASRRRWRMCPLWV